MLCKDIDVSKTASIVAITKTFTLLSYDYSKMITFIEESEQHIRGLSCRVAGHDGVFHGVEKLQKRCHKEFRMDNSGVCFAGGQNV